MTLSPSVARRTLLLGTAGLALAATTACNSSAPKAGGAASTAPSGATGFTYTDARDKAITLPALPAVVVAQSSVAAALWDFGYQVKGAYGELRETDGKLDYQAGNLKLDELTTVGLTYGEFDVEKYAALNPDLLIDLCFTPPALWYLPEEQAAQIEALAPTIGLEALNLDLNDVLAQMGELAAKLGAPAGHPEAVAAKTAYEAEIQRVKAAIAANPDLTVLVASGDGDQVWIANADQHPDLAMLKKLGVKFVDHGGKAEDYFTQVSYEELDKYSGDLVWVDMRGRKSPTDNTQAVWKSLAGVKAGQVYGWYPAAPWSHVTWVPLMAAIAEQLTTGKVVTG